MTTIEIQATERSAVGKRISNSERKAGLIPAVMYGGNEDSHFSVTPAAVRHIVYTPDFRIAEVTFGVQIVKAILKQLQFHPVTDQILHIDFLRRLDKTPIKVEVPLRFKGSSPGVKVGG